MPKIVSFFARAIVLGLIMLVLLLAGLIVEIKPACGCGPIDAAVSFSLHRLDKLVQEYAASHNGLYPTYAELAALAGPSDRHYVDTWIRFRVVYYYEEERQEIVLTPVQRSMVESYAKGDLSIEQLANTLDCEEIDQLVNRYRVEHSDSPDTFLTEPEEAFDDFSRLTPEVDINRRSFRFRLTQQGPVGYAVAPDRRSYVLIGAGWGQRSVSLYHFVTLPLGYGPRILSLQP